MCAACLQNYLQSEYSKNQLKKKASRRRCPECVSRGNPPSDVIGLMLLIRDKLPRGISSVVQSYIGADDPCHASLATIINAVGPGEEFFGCDFEAFLRSRILTEIMTTITDSFKPYDLIKDEMAELKSKNRQLKRELRIQNSRHREEICRELRTQNSRHRRKILWLENRLQSRKHEQKRWKHACRKAEAEIDVYHSHVLKFKRGIFGISGRNSEVHSYLD